jgi:hypothetical protein
MKIYKDELHMAKLSTKKSTALHRCIVFGAPKTGKSLLAGKLAEYYNLIWVDMENGHETLFQLPDEWQERIELIDIPDTRSYPMAIETCLKMVKGPVDICEEHGKCGCMVCKKKELPFIHTNLPALHDLETVVVFDSLTQLSNSCIANITKGQPDDYKLDYDDWGNLGKLLDIFLSHLQQSNYHVVVISHEIEAVTEGKKSRLVPVGGTRNFSRNIAKYFDHVVYAEVKNRKHTFASSTTYATTILTGSRTDVAIEDGAEPSLLQIFKPELYPPAPATSSSQPTHVPKATGVPAATNVLARLGALKK